MYGAGQSLGEGPVEAREAEGSSLAGVGMCPEGIETNPVIYDLMSEWAFRYGPHHVVSLRLLRLVWTHPSARFFLCLAIDVEEEEEKD